MILAQSKIFFTDGFWGYLSNLSLLNQSLTHSLTKTDLRDASASKNTYIKWSQLLLQIARKAFLSALAIFRGKGGGRQWFGQGSNLFDSLIWTITYC